VRGVSLQMPVAAAKRQVEKIQKTAINLSDRENMKTYRRFSEKL
jgi:hypothetical protein